MNEIYEILLTNMVIIRNMIAKYEEILKVYENFSTMLSKVLSESHTLETQKFILRLFLSSFAEQLGNIEKNIEDSADLYNLHNETGLVLSLKYTDNTEDYVDHWNRLVTANTEEDTEDLSNYYMVEEISDKDPWDLYYDIQSSVRQ